MEALTKSVTFASGGVWLTAIGELILGNDVTSNKRYDQLIEKHLQFYEDLRTGKRKPATMAQLKFQRVALRREEPTTDHELAYIDWLRKKQLGPFSPPPPPMAEEDEYPPGVRPVSQDTGGKWDNAWRDRKGNY